MTEKKRDYKIPKSFDEIDPERKEYIRQLAEDEFYGTHPEYIYCENNDGFRRYILENQLEKYENYFKISIEKLQQIKSDFLKRKLKSPPLSPIGLSLKTQILAELEDTDRIRKIDSGIEVKKHTNQIEVMPLYKRIPFIYIISIALGFPLLIYFVLLYKSSGSLLIVSGNKIQSVQIDSTFYGFKTDTITNTTSVIDIPIGTHSIKINLNDNRSKEMQISINGGFEFKLNLDDDLSQTIPINISNSDYGYISFESDLKPFTAYIDNIVTPYSGRWAKISTGEHTFRIAKEGFRTQPSFRSFLVSKGDSIKLRFKLIKNSDNRAIISGTIDVSSNVRGATIFLNDKNSGYSSDHIFSGLKTGQYKIHLEKTGFKVLNNNQVIRINEEFDNIAVHFKLEGNSKQVKIKTEGIAGPIFIDGKQLGTGLIEQSLAFGNYRVSYGGMDGFITPDPIDLKITSVENKDIIVRYYPIINYSAQTNSLGLVSTNFSFKYGYSQFDRFIEDNKHGPKIVSDLNNKSVMQFSFPFAYNNPKGGHAIKINFSLPRTFYLSQIIYLKLGILFTDENYSLVGAGQARISIIINNRRQLMNVEVKNKRELVSGYPTQNFKINDMLRTGSNEIILYLPDQNSSFMQLNSIYLGQ